jgi:hypothetical protein
MWAAYTEIDAEPDVESILKAIKNGQVKAVQTKHYLNVGTSFNH